MDYLSGDALDFDQMAVKIALSVGSRVRIEGTMSAGGMNAAPTVYCPGWSVLRQPSTTLWVVSLAPAFP